MRKFLIIVLLILGMKLSAQELNCVVLINSAEIGVSNRKIFDNHAE